MRGTFHGRQWAAVLAMALLAAISVTLGLAHSARAADRVTTGTGLVYEDLVVGTGPRATPGRRVTVHYTGRLADGTQFDSSRSRHQPFTFSIGAEQVIKGWDQGVVGMRVGGKRRLTIPPQLGYGKVGIQGIIPPGATLIFDVELLQIR